MCATSTPDAPWYIVPADRKWFTRLAVAAIAIETLASLDLHVPVLSRPDHRALRQAMAAEGLTEVRFAFDHDGSTVIVRD